MSTDETIKNNGYLATGHQQAAKTMSEVQLFIDAHEYHMGSSQNIQTISASQQSPQTTP